MFVLIPTCLVLAGLFIYVQRKGYPVPALILKGLASLCFVVLGFLCSPGTLSARLILSGLCLGCAADVLLGLRSVFVQQKQMFFLAGGVVFFGGHLLYLAAVWPMLKYKALCVMISVLLTYILLRWLFDRIEAPKALKRFGAVYFGVFMLLNCAAVCNAITAPSAFSILLASGTLLFLCSDVILNLYSFGSGLGFGFRVLYSALYYIGQILIALSLLFL